MNVNPDDLEESKETTVITSDNVSNNIIGKKR